MADDDEHVAFTDFGRAGRIEKKLAVGAADEVALPEGTGGVLPPPEQAARPPSPSTRITAAAMPPRTVVERRTLVLPGFAGVVPARRPTRRRYAPNL